MDKLKTHDMAEDQDFGDLTGAVNRIERRTMTTYKIIESEQALSDKNPVVELRLVLKKGWKPILQGRNPGQPWYDILSLDKDGEAALMRGAANIEGISTDRCNNITVY